MSYSILQNIIREGGKTKIIRKDRVRAIEICYDAIQKSIKFPLECLIFQVNDKLVKQLTSFQNGDVKAAELSLKGLLRYIFLYYYSKIKKDDIYKFARYIFGSSRKTSTFASKVQYALLKKNELLIRLKYCPLRSLFCNDYNCCKVIALQPGNKTYLWLLVTNVEIRTNSSRKKIKDLIKEIFLKIVINNCKLFDLLVWEKTVIS